MPRALRRSLSIAHLPLGSHLLVAAGWQGPCYNTCWCSASQPTLSSSTWAVLQPSSTNERATASRATHAAWPPCACCSPLVDPSRLGPPACVRRARCAQRGNSTLRESGRYAQRALALAAGRGALAARRRSCGPFWRDAAAGRRRRLRPPPFDDAHAHRHATQNGSIELPHVRQTSSTSTAPRLPATGCQLTYSPPLNHDSLSQRSPRAAKFSAGRRGCRRAPR